MLELKENWRAKNDPEFKLFIEDLDKINNNEKIDIKAYGKKECRRSICWTNSTRKAINTMWNLKESGDIKFKMIGDIRVYKNLPIISKKTIILDDEDVKNNEEFKVLKVDDDIVKIKNDRMKINVTHEEFKKYFDLAYCLTTHKIQGTTINEEYSIYEFRYMNTKLRYTAMSRSTQRSYINFPRYIPVLNVGYIYKVTGPNNKIYIGSTDDYEQRFKEHKISTRKDKFHNDIRKYGANHFKFEVIQTINYIDPEQLLISEQMQIDFYDTLNTGYNSKLAIDILQ